MAKLIRLTIEVRVDDDWHSKEELKAQKRTNLELLYDGNPYVQAFKLVAEEELGTAPDSIF